MAILTILPFTSFCETPLGKVQSWVKVEPLNANAVKGEPIYIKITKFGTPYGGDLSLDGQLCQRPYAGAPDKPRPTPGTKETLQAPPQFNPTERTSIGPLIFMCDLKLKDMQNREYELCYEDPWVKGCGHLHIEEPLGEDAKVYAKMNTQAHDYTDSGITPQEIITKYPTSTYAAWAWPHPGADLKYGSGKEFIDDMLKPLVERKRWGTYVTHETGKEYPKTKDGKYSIKSAEEEAKEYLQYANAFLSVHPNHLNAGIIEARNAIAYMVLHRWQEAYQAAMKSLSLPWAEWVNASYLPRLEMEKKVLREAKDELVKRGLAKEKDQ